MAAIKENGAASVKEPGCRQFDILVQASKSEPCVPYEVYDNEAALQAHRPRTISRNMRRRRPTWWPSANVRAMTPVAFNSKAR